MQSSFFDVDNRFLALSKFGDPLERLNKAIDWEIFCSDLALVDEKDRKNNAGRKPIDRIRMFKMLILQAKHNVSDDQLEYLVKDRLSFSRFVGVDLAGNVPDAKTVWLFRDSLKEADLLDKLFQRFDEALSVQGVVLNSGQIVDATFVSVPIQRNSREDNATIKAGETPEAWQADTPLAKNKLAQKDVEAHWTKKGGVSHYGYKNHVNVDADTKLITAHTTTSAEVHDSKALEAVLRDPEEGGKTLHADSAYRGAEIEETLKAEGFESQIHERAYKDKPLTEAQKAKNTEKSRVRARVEHVFGYMTNSMGGIVIRSIGIARAKVNVALKNLTYNLCRVETLIRIGKFDFQKLALTKTTG